MRQAGQEADERFLNHVFAGRAVAETAVHEREQPPFESLDELAPRFGVPCANLPDQNSIGLCNRHRESLPRDASTRGKILPAIASIVHAPRNVCLSCSSRVEFTESHVTIW